MVARSLARDMATALARGVPRQEGSAGPTVYLQDDFTDVNGTALTAHTMTLGPGWVGFGVQFFDIQGNATREQFGNPGFVVANAGAASGVYRVTVSAAGAQMALRVTDADNALIATNPSSTQITLVKRDATVETVVASNSALSALSYPATFIITISGNNFTVLDQGTGQSIAGSDAFNASATRFGFRAQTALITYDNFSFQSA